VTAQFVTQIERKPLVPMPNRKAIAIYINDGDLSTVLRRPKPAGQLWERLAEREDGAS
jgi:hypothetical protein